MKEQNVTFSIVLPKPMNKELEQAAKETGLIKADVMRQSIKFGLPKLREVFVSAQATSALVHR